MTINLPQEKRDKFFNQVEKFHQGKTATIKKFAEILGFLISCCPAVPYSLAHTKTCKREKFLALEANGNNFDAKMIITEGIVRELSWWKKNIHIPRTITKDLNYKLVIFSDASLSD